MRYMNMKALYIALTLVLLMFSDMLIAQHHRKEPSCDYVVENPRYFINPVGYFRVSGLPDSSVERKVNDSVKDWFCKPTEYYNPNKPVAKGYRNYKKKKGEVLYQYHLQCSGAFGDTAAGIVLKDKDTLETLGPAGIKGTGAHLCAWSSAIYATNLLVIVIEYDPVIERDTLEDPVYFHLQTGERLHPQGTIHFLPELRDSAEEYLRACIDRNVAPAYKGMSIDSLFMPDSIELNKWQVSNYYYGGPIQLYFSYVVDGVRSDGTRVHQKLCLSVTYDELKKFTDGRLEAQLDNYARQRD